MKSKKAKLIVFIIAFIVILTSISCKKDKIIPTADFSITLQAAGAVRYLGGIIVGADYLVKATVKEITGVGAQILTVKTVFIDGYGNTDTFNNTGGEVFNGGYIAANNQIIGTVSVYIGAAHLAAAKTVQMTIEFLDDNAHHIIKTAQANVQW